MKVRIPASIRGALGSSTALVLPLCSLGSLGSLGASGCAATQTTPVAVVPVNVTASPAAAPPPTSPAELEDDAQVRAQHTWCKYLEALYLRSTDGATTWPRHAQCDLVRTPAAPTMLQRTAECSMAALQKFEGDPFTPEYAAEVTRCGRESLAATTLSARDFAPFVTTICARATACGTAAEPECSEAIHENLGPSLRRALGAINTRGRAELRACIESAPCDAAPSDQITGCLTPIMDRLLWLPE